MSRDSRESFFRELYADSHQGVFAFLLGQTGSRETAKDLLQEAFLRVWNRIDAGYEMGLSQARYWVFRIARNLVVDHYRRQSVRKNAHDRLTAEAVAIGSSVSAEEAYESADRLRRVDEAVRRLPEELRSVLVLHLVGKLNSGQIGEVLDLPPGTVRYRLSMARQRLRQALEERAAAGRDQGRPQDADEEPARRSGVPRA